MNHHKQADVFLQHYKNKMLHGAKTSKNKLVSTTKKIGKRTPKLRRKINMSKSNNLLQFNELTTKNYKKICEPEEYDVKYKAALAKMLKKDKNFRPGEFKKVGRYLQLSPKEKAIFIKKNIRVNCSPKKKKLKKNSAGYNEVCWHNKECKGDLYCTHPAPNTKGVCRSKKKNKKLNKTNSTGTKCSKTKDCNPGFRCKGAIRFVRSGKCVKNTEPAKNISNLKNRMRNNYRITY